MSGRVAFWIALPLLVAALAAESWRARDQLEANRILHQVEQMSVLAAKQAGSRAAPLFWANVKVLQRAEELAPADSRLPLARGSQFLLLGRPGEAAAAYEQALAVSPRPEIYLNLGRAQAMAGEAEAARESYRRALALDPFLRDQVPAEMRPQK